MAVVRMNYEVLVDETGYCCVKGHGYCQNEGQVVHVPFPFVQTEDNNACMS